MVAEQARAVQAWQRGDVLLLLNRSGVPLGRLTVRQVGGFAAECAFESLPAFSPHRALFEEDSRLARQLVTDDSPEVFARAQTVQGELQALGLTLRAQDGHLLRDFLLGIEGECAEFRAMNSERSSADNAF